MKWDQSITHTKKPMRNRKANTFLTVMHHLRPVCLFHQPACENHEDKACMHEKIGSLQDTRSTVYFHTTSCYKCVGVYVFDRFLAHYMSAEREDTQTAVG